VTGSASDAVRERIRAIEGGGMRTFADPNATVWARAEGAHLWDEDGRRYLDLYAGFAVANVGHCHPRVTAAIREQAGLLTHCPSAAPSRVRAELYERLLAIAPAGLTRVLCAVTGSLANELALALARAATGRCGVLTFSGTYLGRTSGAVGLAGKRAYREPVGARADAQFLPFPDPFRSPWARGGDVGDMVLGLVEQALADPASGVDPVAAVVIEPIQGNAGVLIPPPGFLAGLRSLCDRHGALLVFDEIQCGFGRAGTMWASAAEGVTPDLMTVGKGIGGGLALAAVLGRDDVMSTWTADATTSTFLTNALNERAACAAIDVLLDEGLVERSRVLGERAIARLRAGLEDHPRVGEIRGRGLFAGIELGGETPDAEGARAARLALRDRGLIVGASGRHGNVLKLAPPLVIDEHDLDGAIDTIVEVLA
jgi:4-aminobutyrate aminotransferase-like enzyme